MTVMTATLKLIRKKNINNQKKYIAKTKNLLS